LANRSIILLFFNFIEVIASFGVIYAAGNYLNQPVQSWVDALYFSFITGVTIGYGDFHPVNEQWKDPGDAPDIEYDGFSVPVL
jgi:hypothetical protein